MRLAVVVLKILAGLSVAIASWQVLKFQFFIASLKLAEITLGLLAGSVILWLLLIFMWLFFALVVVEDGE